MPALRKQNLDELRIKPKFHPKPLEPVIGFFSITAWLYLALVTFQTASWLVNGAQLFPQLKRIAPFCIDQSYDFWISAKLDDFFSRACVHFREKQTISTIGSITAWQGEAVAKNTLLMTLFFSVHYFFSMPLTKKLFGVLPEGSISAYRSMLISAVCMWFQLLMACWTPVFTNEDKLWEFVVPEPSRFSFRSKEKAQLPLFGYGQPEYLRFFCFAAFAISCFWTLSATFAIDHFELTGVLQGTGVNLYKKLGLSVDQTFTNRLHYRFCRFPVFWGIMCALFATPEMTIGHMFFAITTSLYILLFVKTVEEPELKERFIYEYKLYMKSTPLFNPLMKIAYMIKCGRKKSVAKSGKKTLDKTMPKADNKTVAKAGGAIKEE